MFTPNLSKLIGIASISLILCACGGSDENSEGSALESYDDSQAALDSYDDSNSMLDDYDDSQAVLDSFDDSDSMLDDYDDSQAALDSYDDSESVLDSFLDGEPGNDWGGSSGGTDSDDSDGGGNGNNNPPPISYLDCSSLDPNKVYFLGALRDGLGVNYALIDPEDPSRTFCVGLDNPSSVLISTNGLIYDYAGINQFVQDELGYSTNWDYPQFPQSDDIELSDKLVDHIFLRNNDAIYFEDEDNLYSLDQAETPYYENLDGDVHIITPDGGIVISNSWGDELYYIDPDLNRIQLDLPEAGQFTFMSARMHGSDDIWLHVIDSDDNDKRWNINISTQLVTDEGSFSGIPENMRAATAASQGGRRGVAKMNSEGELIQMGLDDSQEEFYKYVIFKRFVESTEASTQILLSDAGYTGNFHWDEDEFPYVHIQVGMMVTGF